MINYKVHLVGEQPMNSLNNIRNDQDSFFNIQVPAQKSIKLNITFEAVAVESIIIKTLSDTRILLELFNFENNREINKMSPQVPQPTFIKNGNETLRTFKIELQQNNPFSRLRVEFIPKQDFLRIRYVGLVRRSQPYKKQTYLDGFMLKSSSRDNDAGQFTAFTEQISQGRDPAGRPSSKIKQNFQKEDEQLQMAIEASLQVENNNKQKEDDDIIFLIDEEFEERGKQVHQSTYNQNNKLGYTKPQQQQHPKQQFGLQQNNKLGYHDNQSSEQKYSNNNKQQQNNNNQQQQQEHKQHNNEQHSNRNHNHYNDSDNIIMRYMNKYQAYEINQEFMSLHRTIELSKGKKPSEFLSSQMYETYK